MEAVPHNSTRIDRGSWRLTEDQLQCIMLVQWFADRVLGPAASVSPGPSQECRFPVHTQDVLNQKPWGVTSATSVLTNPRRLSAKESMFSNCGAGENSRVPWSARSSQSILKEINPEYSLEGLMLKLKLQYFGHLMQTAGSSEKTLMLGNTEGRRRRGNREWDGWMASPTQWTWVWANSGRWWRTGRPGVSPFKVSQRVRYDWGTAQQYYFLLGFPSGSGVKNLPANGDVSSIPGSGKSPEGGDGNSLQYSFLGNPMDRGAGGLQSMGSQESDMTRRQTTSISIVLLSKTNIPWK